MVFSSHVFLFYFLTAALALYYLSPRWLKHVTLAAVSYVFYGWANPLFTVLMFVSTLVDYLCGLALAGKLRPSAWRGPVPLLPPGQSRTGGQRWVLAISMVSNLGLLGFFKYGNFFLMNYTALVESLGLTGMGLENVLKVTLPLGISFYTFQSMSYTIDVYRGDARAIRNPIDYWCYVAMFPQLVAGPIVRFRDVADQLRNRTHTIEKFTRGIAFVGLGLGKKILLANPCGKVADMAFDAGSVGWLDSWVGAVAYAFQIYFDFSAYSDMAIGLGLMLGFMFAKNFDSPYLSQSITEFWRRWHLSLSTWLRDNLYVPLGGNRKGPVRTHINLALVMLLGGLWHGASWNFVIWGGIHGLLLIIERCGGKDALYQRLPRLAKTAMTFVIVCFTWVFFRAADLPAALQYCQSMLGLTSPQSGAGLIGGLIYQPYYVLSMLLAAAVVWSCPQTWDFTRTITWTKALWITAVFWLAIAAMTVQEFNPFIYFIF
ncbi:MAG: MBOAT family O-acyltransferase [Thermoguttaceae bacterium]|nr:MBOAT family O-acyltransferase [Thermoguttaceae bacterium]